MPKGLPDPLNVHNKKGLDLPDPARIMEGSTDRLAMEDALKVKPAEVPVLNTEIKSRVADFATLEQTVGQRATAAGAVRNENQADLLGYAPPAKRRSASRQLLG